MRTYVDSFIWGCGLGALDGYLRHLPLGKATLVGGGILLAAKATQKCCELLARKVATLGEWKIVNYNHLITASNLACRVGIVATATSLGAVGSQVAATILLIDLLKAILTTIRVESNSCFQATMKAS